MGMDQYLYIPFLVGWTSIYQLFWCSPGVQGFDTLPYHLNFISYSYFMITSSIPKTSRRTGTAPCAAQLMRSPPISLLAVDRIVFFFSWDDVSKPKISQHMEYTRIFHIYIYSIYVIHDMEYDTEYSGGKMGDLRSTSAQLCRSDDEDLTLPKGRCVLFFFDGRQTQMGPQMGPQSEEIRPGVGGFTNGLIFFCLQIITNSFQDFFNTDFDSWLGRYPSWIQVGPVLAPWLRPAPADFWYKVRHGKEERQEAGTIQQAVYMIFIYDIYIWYIYDIYDIYIYKYIHTYIYIWTFPDRPKTDALGNWHFWGMVFGISLRKCNIAL